MKDILIDPETGDLKIDVVRDKDGKIVSGLCIGEVDYPIDPTFGDIEELKEAISPDAPFFEEMKQEILRYRQEFTNAAHQHNYEVAMENRKEKLQLEEENRKLQEKTNYQEPIKQYDVFISHAYKDKDNFVRPFAKALEKKAIKVWYDEYELKIGDSLSDSIANGLKNSKYGIVVLSKEYFNKIWTKRELNGLLNDGDNKILPMLHNISIEEVKQHNVMLADLFALNTADYSIDDLAEKIAEKVNASKIKTPVSETDLGKVMNE